MYKSILTIFAIGFLFATSSQASPARIGPSATIFFEAGTFVISDDGKDKLIELLRDARADGKVEQIQIATWSDNFIPLGEARLSEADRKLADQRSTNVRSFLKDKLNVDDITIHNMAERSTWLSRLFETDDALLKTDMSKNQELPMSKAEFRVFKEHGQPSTSVVLVILKD